MNPLLWIFMLLLLGLATGKVVGALTAFTRGPALYDLLAGGLGALIGGGLLRWIGPLSLRAPPLPVLGGLGVAFLATWLTRIATWPAEPRLTRPDNLSAEGFAAHRPHELMTTAEGSRLLLKQGHLVMPRSKSPETEPTV
ncbi:MAG TPA: hypothetical protein VJN70_10610 [Gemmatimonadaceae bacterium]|nr:hypothetical protein [Gemmatimonadaceae bacterium]